AFYAATDNLQYRSNCYGFAIRAFYTGALIINNNNTPYKQQPGEFTPNKANLPNYSSLGSYIAGLLDEFNYDSSNTLLSIMDLVELDIDTFGGTVSGKAKYTSVSQIPSASDYSNRRLVLLVTGGHNDPNDGDRPVYDFHFYVQNGDNTWSHKPGSSCARNICLGGCSNPGSTLTNSNILDHLSDEYYIGTNYIFFWITLPANVENIRNDDGRNSSNTTYYFGDDCGNTLQTAGYKQIDTSIFQGKIDYIGDIDIFSVTRSLGGLVTFSVTTGNGGFPITVEVMDDAGTTIGSVSASSGSGSFNVTLTRGKLYYLKIFAPGQTAFEELKEYQVIIS
ncbi:MAG: hypothetical protein K5647_00255, partial [Clostridiales bacterium]|nr:hypothetical protein [Clostridiales bacterium]